MERRTWTFIVGPADAGLRLDQLVSRHTGLSRREAREALKLGGVQVGRRRVKVAGRTIPEGREIYVTVDPGLGEIPVLEPDVLHEDAWTLMVNKPAGIPTQGTRASDRHDLLALLKRMRPELDLHIVHRLDSGTSGLLLLAKGREAATRFGDLWKGREVRKAYLVRVSKRVEAVNIDRPIGRLRGSSPARFACDGDVQDPLPSQTMLRPALPGELDGLAQGFWVVAEPKTGRTHQIRVHLAALGAPVLGDRLYGGEASHQLWLHAWKLGFVHPFTGQAMEFVAPPARFLEVP